VIIGTRNVEQACDNLLAGGWHLPEDAATKLNTVSVLPERYSVNTEKFFAHKRESFIKMPSLDK